MTNGANRSNFLNMADASKSGSSLLISGLRKILMGKVSKTLLRNHSVRGEGGSSLVYYPKFCFRIFMEGLRLRFPPAGGVVGIL